MNKYLLVLASFIVTAAHAQTWKAGFDNFSLPNESAYVNFSKPLEDVGFTENNIHFPCVYDTSWGGFWVKGFAYSNVTDTITGQVSNQYAAMTGGGKNSSNYAVAYGNDNWITMDLPQVLNVPLVYGFYITNSTYAYHSMKEGDAFSKKFGGPNGTDPDYFRLKAFAYNNGVRKHDSAVFYLADFTSSDPTQDYIIKDWRWFDLSHLGYADSLSLHLESSDNGQWGMNTPAYFCMDDFFFSYPLKMAKVTKLPIAIVPNPSRDYFRVHTDTKVKELMVVDLQGRLMYHQNHYHSGDIIPTHSWPAGNYLLRVKLHNESSVHKLTIQ